MSKRLHKDAFSSEEQVRQAPSKRRQMRSSEDALSVLLSHADDLFDLKSQTTDLSSASRGRLLGHFQKLSSALLPAVKFLADHEDAESQKEGKPESDSAVQQSAPSTSATPSLPTQTPATSCSPIPSPYILSPFQPNDITSVLPPLPQILNPALEAAAFTHSGVAQANSPSYERLEWLGDAYTEIISSSLIFSTFGRYPVGKLSQLRELLICNQSLGQFSKQYRLMERVKLPPEIVASKDKIKKVPGDVFEAYVAAVILSDPEQGLRRAAEWLKALWSTVIKDQLNDLGRNPDKRQVLELGGEPAVNSEVLPKTRLAQLIQARGVALRYEDDGGAPKKDKYNSKLPVYTVKVVMDGWGEKNKFLGRGTGKSKKEAGQKAAETALLNQSLIKKYSQKKAALEAARGADHD